MAIVAHPAENNIKAGMVGGIRRGDEAGILVDGDLTSVAAAQAAVQADVDKLHIAEKNIGPPVKAAIAQIDNYLASGSSGSDVSAVTDLLPNTRGRSLVY